MFKPPSRAGGSARPAAALRAAALCLALSLGAPAAQAEPPLLTLRQALREALAGNPGLAALRRRAEALAQVPVQAGTLPDPRLHLNAMNLPVDTFALSQEAMTQLQVGISQALPFPGKLALREAVARHRAEAAAAQVEELRLGLARDVRLVWWNLFYLDRALEILQRNRGLLRQFVSVARSKYEVGKGLQQDVLLAELELSRLLDEELALRELRRREEARLDALLGRQALEPVRLPEEVLAGLPAPPDPRELLAEALGARPLLAVRRAELEAARSALALARRDRLPDFQVAAAYGYRRDAPGGRSRADFLSLMFSMSLPLRADRRQDRAVDERAARLAEARERLAEARLAVQREIAQALADLRRAREQARLVRTGIIPQARQTVGSMLAGYQVSQVDFLNLVRAQVTLFRYETRYWKAFAEAQQALARLQAAAGREPLPRTSRRGRDHVEEPR